MRCSCRCLALLACLTGCALDRAGVTGGGSIRDAEVVLDASRMADAGPRLDSSTLPVDGGPLDAGLLDTGSAACPGGVRLWAADFSVDPTTIDLGGDGADWVMREGHHFPMEELEDGVWRATGSEALDTRPLHDFTGRTTVTVVMRSLSEDGRGAVFWINPHGVGAGMAAIYVSLQLQPSGTQTLVLSAKTNGSDSIALTTITGLGDGAVRIVLDIDARAGTAGLTVDGTDRGRFTYPTFAPPNGDRFATLIAWDSDAEFDSVRIETCD